MANKNVEARMEDLFTYYYTLLTLNGLPWIITVNPKVAVKHVLSAIRPQTRHDRLGADLDFAGYDLRKAFKGFLAHAIKLAVAFQIVDARPPTRSDDGYDPQGGDGSGRNGGRGGRCGGGRGRGQGRGGNNKNWHTTPGTSSDGKTDGLSLCLWEPHRRKVIRHKRKDCPDCPLEEKKALFAHRAEEKARSGLSTGTRSQNAAQPPASHAPTGTQPTTGRLQHPVSPFKYTSCQITVSDRPASYSGTGRCDDGSDESTASPALSQEAVVKDIGGMSAISPVKIQVALHDSGKTPSFTFSRTWHVPRVVLQLSAGEMALLNVSFLVDDDEPACKDLLVGLPVLRHLGID